jgi:hypothetical protein
MKKLLFALLLTSCTQAPMELKPEVKQATQQAVTFAVNNEDAYVSEHSPSTNYGTSSNLVVKGANGYNSLALFKFHVDAPVSKATLKVYIMASSAVQVTPYEVTGDWSELNVTWNNKPTLGQAGSPLSVSGGWYNFDVSNLVTGKTDISLALKSTQDIYARSLSRESSTPPQLLIEGTDTTSNVDTTATDTTTTQQQQPTASAPDHVIIVFMENKGYPQIVGSSSAPYINSLIKKGTLFTASYGVTHPSYPNYIAFFSGATQGITNDNCISGTPYSAKNLYTVLNDAGKSFAWYSEGLPSTGSGVCSSGYYREKHNPVTIFSNVPTSANKPFSSFPTDYTKLENVVCITPNMIDDWHDGSISQGDTWVKNKLGALADWCMTHNSILLITCDEDNKNYGNRIPTIAVGQNIKVGQDATKVNHYSFTRSIANWFNADSTFSSSVKAAATIKNIWK